MNNDIAKTLHFQEVNGINLHYVTWGEYTRPERAVALVHGLTANHQEWAKLGPTLAEEGWFAIAPDLRGRGQSEKPPHGYGIPYHVNDLLTLCDTLGLPGCTSSVIHSERKSHTSLLLFIQSALIGLCL